MPVGSGVRKANGGVTMPGMSHSSSQRRRAALLRDLERSGLSVAEFCRRRGLAYSTVAAWRAECRRSAAPRFIEVEAALPDPPAARTHAPASPDRPMPSALCAELTLPGGAVLRVYAPLNAGGAA
jgi:hypothetical protein